MNDTNHIPDDIAEEDLPSGRFVLRIPPALHAALKAAADDAGTSLNEHCARKVASPGPAGTSPLAEALERCGPLVSSGLLGIAAFGSWARGEATASSDLDLLIVLDRTTAIERYLYASWDDDPLTYEGLPVAPHFVHPPHPDGRVSGLWAEASIDGIVLFERDLALSRILGGVRARILAGDLVRRESHGHAYWVEVA